MFLEAFAELHTLTVFEQDSKPWLPIILTERTNLVDKFKYQTSLPLASRIGSRSHMEPVDRHEMKSYLLHHLSIAGLNSNVFDDPSSPRSIKVEEGYSERQITWHGEASPPRFSTGSYN